MGHIWYGHVMGEFSSKRQSDSLFVITGDHSERFTFAHEKGPKVASTIPIIFYGQGIKRIADAFGMSIKSFRPWRNSWSHWGKPMKLWYGSI